MPGKELEKWTGIVGLDYLSLLFVKHKEYAHNSLVVQSLFRRPLKVLPLLALQSSPSRSLFPASAAVFPSGNLVRSIETLGTLTARRRMYRKPPQRSCVSSKALVTSLATLAQLSSSRSSKSSVSGLL